MSWYRTYRPRKISELHLDNVRQALATMLESGKIPQVLLFAGPRGTGKTSASRIIGALLNDPKNEAQVQAMYFGKQAPKKTALQEPASDSPFAESVFSGKSYVVQEMDAASNRGIDDVRALRDRVMLPPSEGLISVYILDEAHMLTTEAFNALLKLLEEPPPHVVFILATTELHKVPSTIISRSTLVQFRKATTTEIKTALTQILDKEKLTYEPEALDEIVHQAEGSFRDAVKLLELVAQAGSVSQQAVVTMLGKSSFEAEIKEIIKSVIDKDEKSLVLSFARLREQGVNAKYFLESFLAFLHSCILQELQVIEGEPFVKKTVAVYLLGQVVTPAVTQGSAIPLLPLEIKLLEIIEKAQQQKQGSHGGGGGGSGAAPKKTSSSIVSTQSTPSLVKKKTETVAEIVSSIHLSSRDELTELAQSTEPEMVSAKPTLSYQEEIVEYASDEELAASTQSLLNQWDTFIQTLSQDNSTLAALLRSSKPSLNADGRPAVEVFYKFHQEQLEQPKFSSIIESCTEKVVGKRIKFAYVLATAPEEKPADATEQGTSSNLSSLASEALM